ncbi:hypothetical protein TNCV_2795771 [Trichonephila clavipes]|nr:hypothetical protein TNCV_2795771 [Trichonephila clavipes]
MASGHSLPQINLRVQGGTQGDPTNVPRQTVSFVICRFKELGNDGRRPESERKGTVNSSRNCKAIEKASPEKSEGFH